MANVHVQVPTSWPNQSPSLCSHHQEASNIQPKQSRTHPGPSAERGWLHPTSWRSSQRRSKVPESHQDEAKVPEIRQERSKEQPEANPELLRLRCGLKVPSAWPLPWQPPQNPSSHPIPNSNPKEWDFSEGQQEEFPAPTPFPTQSEGSPLPWCWPGARWWCGKCGHRDGSWSFPTGFTIPLDIPHPAAAPRV